MDEWLHRRIRRTFQPPIWGLRRIERERIEPFFKSGMPFPVTRREKIALSVIALLLVLGLIGMAVL
jgi:hypothetical protein